MSMADGPGFGCEHVGDGSKICDCLGCSLETIAKATTEIARILEERLGKICDNVDECIDEILDKIKERVEGPIYSVDECKRMVAMGKQGTIEYAVRCARETIDQCETECSLGDPTTEGRCCKTCGKSPCCCKHGECVPCGEEEKERKYIGWCDPITKIVVVTRQGESPPGPNFAQVAIADSEQVAFSEAESVCSKVVRPTESSGQQQIPAWNYSVLPFCSLQSLIDGSTLKLASDAQARFYADGGALQVVNALSDIGSFGITTGDIASIVFGTARMTASMPAFFADVAARSFPPVIGCDNITFQNSLRLIASAQLFQHQSGVNFDEFLTPYRYAMHAACRQKHLDPDKAIAAYLANAINRDGLEALWAINGVCPEDVDWYTSAARSKPLPLQLAVMRHRKLIHPDTYAQKMRELGYLEPDVSENLFNITYQVPTLTDITRLMVRDADDDTIPDWPDSDRLFEQKYGRQLQKWAEDQGVPEQFAKYYWRAHWTIPSPTALFTFYHRLRNKPDFWTSRGPLADMEQALIQQDILPRWHKHYLAVSFRPMRLRDIYRGLQIGTVKESDLTQLYADLGYSDETAVKMAELAKRLRDNSIRNHRVIKQWYRFELSRQSAKQTLLDDGIPDSVIERSFQLAEPEFIKSEYAKAFVRGDISKERFIAELDNAGVHLDSIDRMVNVLSLRKRNHPAIADYDAGLLSDSDAIAEMSRDGFDDNVSRRLIDAKEREVIRDNAIRCQNRIRQRFVTGEIDDNEAIAQLTQFGITPKRSRDSVAAWQCELKSGERHASAAMLCEWFARGAINGADFVSRLRRIGYSDIDASLMLEDCGIKLNARSMAKAKREAKEQAMETNRIARALERAARQEAAYLAAIAAKREKANRTRSNRERQLYSAVDKITDKCTCTLQEAITLAKSEVKRIETNYALTIDQSLQALLLASEEFPPGSALSELPRLIDTIANAISTADLNGNGHISGSAVGGSDGKPL